MSKLKKVESIEVQTREKEYTICVSGCVPHFRTIPGLLFPAMAITRVGKNVSFDGWEEKEEMEAFLPGYTSIEDTWGTKGYLNEENIESIRMDHSEDWIEIHSPSAEEEKSISGDEYFQYILDRIAGNG